MVKLKCVSGLRRLIINEPKNRREGGRSDKNVLCGGCEAPWQQSALRKDVRRTETEILILTAEVEHWNGHGGVDSISGRDLKQVLAEIHHISWTLGLTITATVKENLPSMRQDDTQSKVFCDQRIISFIAYLAVSLLCNLAWIWTKTETMHILSCTSSDCLMCLPLRHPERMQTLSRPQSDPRNSPSEINLPITSIVLSTWPQPGILDWSVYTALCHTGRRLPCLG